MDENGKWVRCECHKRERWEEWLGSELFCEDPELETPLLRQLRKNVILIGTRVAVERHVAGAVIHEYERDQSWEFLSLKQDRLLDIWFKDDEEGIRTFATLERKDLVLLWLGWGDRRANRERSNAVDDLLSGREHLRKPTWIYMNFDMNELGSRYPSLILKARLEDQFEQIDVE